jgi:hypothetical protein
MRPTPAVLALLVAALLAGTALASPLVPGSRFPFENCKLDNQVNRWTVGLASYNENAQRGSWACFQFGVKPVDQCTPNGLRCCGENRLNK